MFLQDWYVLLDPDQKDILFLWSSTSSLVKKVQAMKSVKEFLIQRGLPKSTKIKRIAENNEPVVFKQYFESWKEPSIESQNDEVFNKDQEVNANVQNDDPLPLPHEATDQQVKFLYYVPNLTMGSSNSFNNFEFKILKKNQTNIYYDFIFNMGKKIVLDH